MNEKERLLIYWIHLYMRVEGYKPRFELLAIKGQFFIKTTLYCSQFTGELHLFEKKQQINIYVTYPNIRVPDPAAELKLNEKLFVPTNTFVYPIEPPIEMTDIELGARLITDGLKSHLMSANRVFYAWKKITESEYKRYPTLINIFSMGINYELTANPSFSITCSSDTSILFK